jgi:16S rRNA (uracil1498-N3)-methyltransferase
MQEKGSKSRMLRVPLSDLAQGERVLPDEAAHYVTRVRRLARGDTFVAFDPVAALEADATVLEATRDRVSCRLEPPRAGNVPDGPRVTLIQCAGKGDKIEEVVRSATALGATAIVFAESERAVVRFGTSDADKRRARLHAVALDAGRQSGRGDLPAISLTASLLEALEQTPPGALKLCLDPEATEPLVQRLQSYGGPQIVLLIGPEGGFSAAEYGAAETAGFVRVRLGRFTLRTELAAAAALGALAAFSFGTPGRSVS